MTRKNTARRQVWDAVADYPAEIYSLFHHATSRTAITSRIETFAKGQSAVDFGCGEGHWLNTLGSFEHILGVDFSSTLIARATDVPSQTRFMVEDISNLDFEAQFDFALNLNALMPESHADAVHTFTAMLRSLNAGGRMIFVTFSTECHQSYVNLSHFRRALAGDEAQSLRETVDSFLQWSNNPLGYIKHRNGTVVKFWVREEAEAFFQMCGDVSILEYFKVPRDWTGPQISGFDPWFHGWVIEKNTGSKPET